VAHIKLFIHQYPEVLLDRADLKPSIPQPVLISEVAPTHVQDLELGLVEPHEVHTGPPLQLVQVPLDGIPSFWRAKCTPLSLVSSADLLRVHSFFFFESLSYYNQHLNIFVITI